MTTIDGAEALAGYSFAIGLMTGAVLCALLIRQDELLDAARRLSAPLAVVALATRTLFASLQPTSRAWLMAPETFVLLGLVVVTLGARRTAPHVGLLSIAATIGTFLSAISLRRITDPPALQAAVDWPLPTLLAASLASGAAALALVLDLDRPNPCIRRPLETVQNLALGLEALSLTGWLVFADPVSRPTISAPDGYSLVLGGIGLGLVAPIILTIGAPEPTWRFLRHIAILVGSLALRHGLLHA